jgi:hypothetical protein
MTTELGTAELRSNLIDDEKTTVVVDAAMLWVRWALRRLEHILLGEADNLISELQGGIVTRVKLRKHLDDAVLPDQSPEVQRAVGVAFAERAAGGTFVAREVGLDRPTDSTDLAEWPAEYRFGLVEGLTLSRNGLLVLSKAWVPVIVSILAPVPPGQTGEFLSELLQKVATAGLAQSQSADALDALAEHMCSQSDNFAAQVRHEWLQLVDVVQPAR